MHARIGPHALLAQAMALVLVACFMLSAAGSRAGAEVSEVQREHRSLTLNRGKSLLLRSDQDITRVSLTAPDIADVRLLSPRQIYLSGKAVGTTDIMFWGDGERLLQIFDLTVVHDLSHFKQMLHEMIPNEKNIEVRATQGSIALSGTVSSPESVATAVSLAESYTRDKGRVVNLLSVRGVSQVMLEVRVAEMSRSLLRQLGFNLAFLMEGGLLNGNAVMTFLDNLTQFDREGHVIVDPSNAPLFITPEVDAAFSIQGGDTRWGGFIDALKANGLVKILAEPNLICLSGQTAHFLAGGEIPIPIPQGLGTVAIEFKEFGVALSFTPTVLGDKINLQVLPEVSELDFTNAITIAGATIPAFSSRRAATTVELRDGQTYAVAGLLSDSVRESIDKLPGLGEIPILGALFRSSKYRSNETELVIMVTPRLAKPLETADQPLPTDWFVPPNDWEFFLLGDMGDEEAEARSERNAKAVNREEASGFDGSYGYKAPI